MQGKGTIISENSIATFFFKEMLKQEKDKAACCSCKIYKVLQHRFTNNANKSNTAWKTAGKKSPIIKMRSAFLGLNFFYNDEYSQKKIHKIS